MISGARAILAKFNLGWVRHYRVPLILGMATLFCGIGLGMILELLGYTSEGDWARLSPTTVVPIAQDKPLRLPTIAPAFTQEQNLKNTAAQEFTMEEPGGDPPVEITEFGEAIYVESVPLPPSANTAKTEEEHQVAMAPPPIDAVDREVSKPAWQRHAAAVTGRRGNSHPLIAIVVDDLGMNRHRTALATALAPPLTLAFLPYASDLKRQTAAARGAGHELLVHVPMEPIKGALNPGPQALVTGMASEEVIRLLDWNLTRFEGFVGLNNHMGSKFTAHREGMEVLMKELHKRGLLYLDSRTTSATMGLELARELGVPHAVRNVFLDNVISMKSVRSRLTDLEDVARRQGFAVGICHPHRVTLEVLEEWMETLEQRGFKLVPLTAIVRHRLGTAVSGN